MNTGLNIPNNSITNCKIKSIKKRIYKININDNKNIKKKKFFLMVLEIIIVVKKKNLF